MHPLPHQWMSSSTVSTVFARLQSLHVDSKRTLSWEALIHSWRWPYFYKYFITIRYSIQSASEGGGCESGLTSSPLRVEIGADTALIPVSLPMW